MSVVLIDEDMPRSTAPALRQAGFEATDARDIGLAGHKDPEIFAHAQALGAVLVTADREFANLLLFPLGTHAGIVVTRIPNEISTRQVNDLLLHALDDLAGQPLRGALVVVRVGSVRIRRPEPD